MARLKKEPPPLGNEQSGGEKDHQRSKQQRYRNPKPKASRTRADRRKVPDPAAATPEELARWEAEDAERARIAIGSAPAVLDSVEAFLSRFVAYPSLHARVAHVLWVAHTHLMEVWHSTPRLALLSAEKEAGKTRLLEITALLVPNAVHSVNNTPAYIVRRIASEDGRPTILYDEVDNLFSSKAPDTGDVKALLNAGHRVGAISGRCVIRGNGVQTEELPAYCAVALAGIGDLPDTIGSRSIIIDMRRRAPDETVEPYRHRLHDAEGHKLGTMIAELAKAIKVQVADALPSLPDSITDRDADCWEPLIAIADAVGEAWPRRARAAAVELAARGRERTQTRGVQLLRDLHEVFGAADKLSTKTIIERLQALPESAWQDIGDRGLATRLKPYEVRPKTVRIGEATPRGYYAADLADAWRRYLGFVSQGRVQQAQQRNMTGDTGPDVEQEAQHPQQSATQETVEDSQKNGLVADVSDVAPTPERQIEDASRRCPSCETLPQHHPQHEADDALVGFEERAAVLEHEAGLGREEAEAKAAAELWPDADEKTKALYESLGEIPPGSDRRRRPAQ